MKLLIRLFLSFCILQSGYGRQEAHVRTSEVKISQAWPGSAVARAAHSDDYGDHQLFIKSAEPFEEKKQDNPCSSDKESGEQDEQSNEDDEENAGRKQIKYALTASGAADYTIAVAAFYQRIPEPTGDRAFQLPAARYIFFRAIRV